MKRSLLFIFLIIFSFQAFSGIALIFYRDGSYKEVEFQQSRLIVFNETTKKRINLNIYELRKCRVLINPDISFIRLEYKEDDTKYRLRIEKEKITEDLNITIENAVEISFLRTQSESDFFKKNYLQKKLIKNRNSKNTNDLHGNAIFHRVKIKRPGMSDEQPAYWDPFPNTWVNNINSWDGNIGLWSDYSVKYINDNGTFTFWDNSYADIKERLVCLMYFSDIYIDENINIKTLYFHQGTSLDEMILTFSDNNTMSVKKKQTIS